LAESELFGYERGGHDHADQAKQGLIEQAEGGTLFCDEIATMSLAIQAKLLRVLETGDYIPLGGTRKTANARVIAATNCNLKEEVKAGRFRKDLYHRLARSQIIVPSLHEHRDDIPLLVPEFLSRWSKENRQPLPIISSEALTLFSQQDWSGGNVRELRNVVEAAASRAWGSVITPLDVQEVLRELAQSSVRPDNHGIQTLGKVVAEAERSAIVHALEQVHWNREKAAELLGIKRKTLYLKMKAYGITPPEK
jgi:DNA-binding NtrC family response regulator